VRSREADFDEDEDHAEAAESEYDAEGGTKYRAVRGGSLAGYSSLFERSQRRRYIRSSVSVISVEAVAFCVVIGVSERGDADDGEDKVDAQRDKLDDPERNEVALLPHLLFGRHCDVGGFVCDYGVGSSRIVLIVTRRKQIMKTAEKIKLQSDVDGF